MTLILGLDIATTTGFALYTVNEPLSTIETGTIKADGADAELKAASLGYKVCQLIKQHHPNFVAIEQPLSNVVQFRKKTKSLFGEAEQLTINPNSLQLKAMAGGVLSVVECWRIPWIKIPIQTWRKHFLGRGREKGWQRADWKRAAIERCRSLHIPVKNNDAAEAVGIALSGSVSQEFKRLNMEAAE